MGKVGASFMVAWCHEWIGGCILVMQLLRLSSQEVVSFPRSIMSNLLTNESPIGGPEWHRMDVMLGVDG